MKKFVIGDKTYVPVKMVPIRVVGMRYEGREAILDGLKVDDVVELRRESSNPHDPNAVGVYFGERHCGYVPAVVARMVATAMDVYNEKVWAAVLETTREPIPAFNLVVLQPEEG